ncbi:hypothetical protein EMCRGX_G029876 [Ephydatia muelleri]|eukprot:Em0010g121a
MKLRVKAAAFGKRSTAIVEADETWSIEKLKSAICSVGISGTFELSLNGSVKLEGGGSLKEFGLVNGDLVFVIDWDQKERETSDSKRDETREQPSCNVVGIRCVSEVNGTSPTSPGHRSPESTTADQGSEAVAMETSLDCHRGTLSAALSSRNNFEKLLSSAVELMEKSCEPLDVLCLAVDALMLDSGFVSCEEATKSLSSCPGYWRHSPHGLHRFKYKSVLGDMVRCYVVCVKMASVLSVHASVSVEASREFPCSLQLPLSAYVCPGSVTLHNAKTLVRTVKDQLTHTLVAHIRKELGLPEVGTFMSLPVDAKLYLMRFMDTASVLALGAVCKEMHLLANDEFVWKHLFLRQFGHQQMFGSYNEQLSWKELYAAQYLRSKEKDRVRAQYYSPPPPHHMSPPFPPNLPDFPGMIGGSYDLVPSLFRPPVPLAPYGSIPHHPLIGDPSSAYRIGPQFPGTRSSSSPYPSIFVRPRRPSGGMRF